jgi:hypothetical protein
LTWTEKRTPGRWESMDQDHEAEATQHVELARARDAAKPDEGREKTPKQIDPERLSKASQTGCGPMPDVAELNRAQIQRPQYSRRRPERCPNLFELVRCHVQSIALSTSTRSARIL